MHEFFSYRLSMDLSRLLGELRHITTLQYQHLLQERHADYVREQHRRRFVGYLKKRSHWSRTVQNLTSQNVSELYAAWMGEKGNYAHFDSFVSAYQKH